MRAKKLKLYYRNCYKISKDLFTCNINQFEFSQCTAIKFVIIIITQNTIYCSGNWYYVTEQQRDVARASFVYPDIRQ